MSSHVDADIIIAGRWILILLIAMFVTWGIMAGLFAFAKRRLRKAQAAYQHILRVELIGRFRVRDFRRFVHEINTMRTEKGLTPVPEATLAKARWEPSFLVDEIERRGPDIRMPKLTKEDLGF